MQLMGQVKSRTPGYGSANGSTRSHMTRVPSVFSTQRILELGEELEAIELLRNLMKLEPAAPERMELIEHLIHQQAHQEALALVESAPTLTPELALKGHELTTSTGPRRLEAPWLERAEALAPHNHKVIFTRYKIQPDQSSSSTGLGESCER